MNSKRTKNPKVTDIPGELSFILMSCWNDIIKVEKIRIRVGTCRTVLNKYKKKIIGGSMALTKAEGLFIENLYPINTITNTIRSKKPNIAIKNGL
jgi:hypothetical protein